MLFERRVRATKMMAYTYLAFLLTYFPVFVFFSISKSDLVSWPNPLMQLLVLGLYWSGSAVNPVSELTSEYVNLTKQFQP